MHVSGLNCYAAGQFGTDSRVWHSYTHPNIRRAAYDLQGLIAGIIDLAYAEIISHWMQRNIHDASHHNACERECRRIHIVECEPTHGEAISHRPTRDRRVHPFSQPCFAELHVLRLLHNLRADSDLTIAKPRTNLLPCKLQPPP